MNGTMTRGDAYFHPGRQTREYAHGMLQLDEWHMKCRIERARQRIAAAFDADERHKREVADIIAWAKATAKRRLAEARAGGAL